MDNKAYIATNLGCAFYFENGRGYVTSKKNGIAAQEIDGYMLSQMFTANPEIKETDFSSIEDLQKQADEEYEKQETLNMVLELMDTSLSYHYRREVAVLLSEELKRKPELVIFIQNRLLSTPLAEAFNPRDARKIAREADGLLVPLYENLEERTKLFAAFYTLLVNQLNIEPGKQKVADLTLTDNGSYSAFVIALHEKSQKLYESAAQSALLSLWELKIFPSKKIFSGMLEQLNQTYQITLKRCEDEIPNTEITRENSNDFKQIEMALWFDKDQLNDTDFLANPFDRDYEAIGFEDALRKHRINFMYKKLSEIQYEILQMVESLKRFYMSNIAKIDSQIVFYRSMMVVDSLNKLENEKLSVLRRLERATEIENNLIGIKEEFEERVIYPYKRGFNKGMEEYQKRNQIIQRIKPMYTYLPIFPDIADFPSPRHRDSSPHQSIKRPRINSYSN